MRVLFIAPSLPVNTGSGGAMRSHQLYQQLKRFSEVDVLTCNSVGIKYPALKRFRLDHTFLRNIAIPSRAPLGERAPRLHPQLLPWLAKTHYDYLVVRYYMSAYWLGLLGLENLILDCDDCYLELMHQVAGEPNRGVVRRFFAQRQLGAFRPRYERQLAAVRAVVFSRKSDQMAWKENFHLLPNRLSPPEITDAAPPDAGQSSPSRDPVVLFVGVLSYGPNYEGLDRFVRNVWPRVVRAEPRAVLRVVGEGLPQKLDRAWRGYPRVELCGYVDDLQAAYRMAHFSIAPVYRGSGTHIKVMESLLLRRTLVLSRRALRGYESTLRDGESLLVADTDDEYVASVLRLIRDPGLVRRLESKGEELVKQHHLARPGDSELRDLLMVGGARETDEPHQPSITSSAVAPPPVSVARVGGCA